MVAEHSQLRFIQRNGVFFEDNEGALAAAQEAHGGAAHCVVFGKCRLLFVAVLALAHWSHHAPQLA
jgi:hypothetical protein